MIIYDGNRHWFRDIAHLARSWTMIKVIRATLGIGIFSTIISLLHIEIVPEGEEGPTLTIFTFLGVVLSILLVFRTNSAYDKWWEGRKQWGALVNNCRNLSIYAHSLIPQSDKGIRRYLAIRISNFCYSLVDHLRDGVRLERLIELEESDIKRYKDLNHIPNKIAGEIWDVLQDAYRRGEITDMDILNLRPAHQSLLDILGACERIKKTPIPFSYAVFLKVFITAYGVLLPFALVEEIGYATIPSVMIVFFAFIGIEMMGEEIEEPFGTDCNDLPTHQIASNISTDVFEILEIQKKDPNMPAPKMYQKVR